MAPAPFGTVDQLVDGRRGYSRRQPLAVLPLTHDLAAHFIEIAALERLAHSDGCISNALEAVEDLLIAIEMALCDFPVVGAGVARGTGVGHDDAPLEFLGIDIQRYPRHPLDAQFHGRDAAVQGRPVVLNPGRHPNRVAFHVFCDAKERLIGGPGSSPPREGTAYGNGQSGRTRDASAGRRLSARGQGRVLQPVVAGE